jgi:hypothetical protein
VDKMVLGQDLRQEFQYYPVSIFPPIFLVHIDTSDVAAVWSEY